MHNIEIVFHEKGSNELIYAKIDGILYVSYSKGDFFYIKNKDIKNVPHVICNCGCDKLMLEYGGNGSCQLLAECSNCGKTDTVYEG